MSTNGQRGNGTAYCEVAFPFRVSSISEKGPVREQNEDNMVHFDSPVGHVVIVADGMGGHGHGDLAAALVVNGFQELLGQQNANELSVSEAIQVACAAVNTRIVEMAASVNQPMMGSTVVMVVLRQSEFYVAHVGDSRAYLIRNGSLTRLTRDHSVVQREVDDGLLTEEQARADSRSSMLTRALGTPNGENIEVQGPMPLQDGDGFLLCSDGLHGFALDRQIEDAIVFNHLDPQKVTTGLVNLAINTYFSNDNVTVQFIQVGKPPAAGYIRPVFGKSRAHAEAPSASHAGEAATPRRSLLSKILTWLNTVVLLAVLGYAALHAQKIMGLFNARAKPETPVAVVAQAAAPAAARNAVAEPNLRVGVVLPKAPAGKQKPVVTLETVESRIRAYETGLKEKNPGKVQRKVDFVLLLSEDVANFSPPVSHAQGSRIFTAQKDTKLQIPRELNPDVMKPDVKMPDRNLDALIFFEQASGR